MKTLLYWMMKLELLLVVSVAAGCFVSDEKGHGDGGGGGEGCQDGVLNGDETDVDCGGSCGPCADGLICASGADCLSGTCGGNSTCVSNLCANNIQDASETGVDCGGPCPQCYGGTCSKDQNCVTGYCLEGKCAEPTCDDGVKNGRETDKDCGGLDCDSCAVGKRCLLGKDCATGICQGGSCGQPDPSCADGQKNGSETDLDCGGSCSPCGLDKSCKENEDCLTLFCYFGTCKVPSCTDSVKNGYETATDCGGRDCPACGVGKSCLVPTDCQTQTCKNGECSVPDPSCSDGVKNGTETDLDCGGSCPPCSNSKVCKKDQDCVTTYCKLGICTQPTCSDGAQNQGESDVDCGVPCSGCANGKDCRNGSDCQSLTCESGTCCSPNLCGSCGSAPTEVCNGYDDDCDGLTDEYLDPDLAPLCPNQFGVCYLARVPCESGGYYSYNCDSAFYQAYAGSDYQVQETRCDGLDNDCDGLTDEAQGVVCDSSYDTACEKNQCAGASGCLMMPAPNGTECSIWKGSWDDFCKNGECVQSASDCSCVGNDNTSYCTRYYNPPYNGTEGASYCSCNGAYALEWINDLGESGYLNCSLCVSIPEMGHHICWP